MFPFSPGTAPGHRSYTGGSAACRVSVSARVSESAEGVRNMCVPGVEGGRERATRIVPRAGREVKRAPEMASGVTRRYRVAGRRLCATRGIATFELSRLEATP